MMRGSCRRNACRISASFRHGAAIAFLIAATSSTAHASRSCLDHVDAAAQMLVQDSVGCWTYDSHLPRTEAPSAIREMIIVTDEPGLGETPPELVPDDEEFAATMSQFVLFVSVVLATASSFAVYRSDHSARHHRAPVRKSW